MKKIVLVFAAGILAFSTAAMAEGLATGQGKFEITAGDLFGYTTRSGNAVDANKKNASKSQLFFGVSNFSTYGLGFFVIENLAVGGGFNYNTAKNDAGEKTTIWQVAPYAKFYIPVSPELLLDAKGSFGYNSEKVTGLDEYTQMTLGIGIGATYLVTESLGITGTFDYKSYMKAKSGGKTVADTDFNAFTFGIGLTAFLGAGSGSF